MDKPTYEEILEENRRLKLENAKLLALWRRGCERQADALEALTK